MVLSELVAAIASATQLPDGRVTMHARKLQEIGLIPISRGGSNAPVIDESHAVLVLLSLLSGKPLHHAAASALEYASMRHGKDIALDYLVAMLRSVSSFDTATSRDIPDTMQLTTKSLVTVVAGDEPAVIIRFTCTDEPLELAFTAGQPYQPDQVETLSEARSLPGIVLFRLGRAINEVSA